MTLTIKIWDVLQGLAIYIRTPNGKDIIIDAGINEKGFSPLKHIKEKYHIGTIEYAIITHPHKDHIEDIENLINFKPKVVKKPSHILKEDIDWNNLNFDDKKLFEKYFEFNDNYSSPISDDHEHNPKYSKNYGGVIIKTFNEDTLSKSNLNNHSIITILEYAGSKILIPGDNESPSWNKLLEDKQFIEAIKGTDVLVAPHHGRESAYYKELFEHISPKLIIISDSPGTDTSANDRYSNHATGWEVYNFSGQESRKRFVLSTRQDGMIQIKCGSGNQKDFMEVKLSK